MSKLKAVLDSNVLISGLLWKGSPNQIIKLSENKYIELFSSPQIIEEVEDVLKRKLFVSRIEAIKTTIEELIESLLSTVVIIHPKIKVNMVKEDKDDNKIMKVFNLHIFFLKMTSTPFHKITNNNNFKNLFAFFKISFAFL